MVGARLMWIAAACTAACGRIGFDPLADAGAPTVFAYMVDQDTNDSATSIYIFSLDLATGAIAETAQFDLGAVPWFVVANPRATALYATSRSGSISTLSIDPATGALTRVASIPAGSWPFMLTFAAGGAIAYAADYSGFGTTTGGAVRGYAVQPDDSLVEIAGSPWPNGGDDTDWVVVDPSDRWLYALDDGSEKLWGYAVGDDGSLTAQPTNAWATGDSGPHAAVIAADGVRGYIAPDLAGGIPAFTIEPPTGKLATAPGSPFGSSANTSEVAAFDASGLLHVANDGNSTHSVFAIDAATGALTHVPGSPLSFTESVWWVAPAPLGDTYVTLWQPSSIAQVHATAAGCTIVAKYPLPAALRAPQLAFARVR